MMNIAVVGSGISGCAAAWELSAWAKVTVFESESRLGGHTHTQMIDVAGQTFPVDTGFIVFNHRTYPGLKAWFEMLGVDTAESDMSFSASVNGGELEWCGSNLDTVFAQRKNLVSPKFWAMLADIVRFNREAPRDAAIYRKMEGGGPTLGEYLDRQGYRRLFLDAYLLPMAGAIWSCPTEQMRAFPMATFTRFCENHGLLTLSQRPQWYTVRNGSMSYIHALQRHMAVDNRDVTWNAGARITQVQPVSSEAGHRAVTLSGEHVSGESFSASFDAVVLACHSDQAALMLPKSSVLHRIASRIRYQDNTAVLHTDTALMPMRRKAWASWNYMHDTGRQDARVSVSYWMNRLQPLPVATPVLVSLNPIRQPSPANVISTMHYAHPIFDGPAVQAQKELGSVQGEHRIWLAGAWTRYGFHEDGFQSGINAARSVQSAIASTGHVNALPKAA